MCGLLLHNILLRIECQVNAHKSRLVCSRNRDVIVERRKRWMAAILLILGIGNIVIMDVTRMDNLEENTWIVFKNLRDFARKTVK